MEWELLLLFFFLSNLFLQYFGTVFCADHVPGAHVPSAVAQILLLLGITEQHWSWMAGEWYFCNLNLPWLTCFLLQPGGFAPAPGCNGCPFRCWSACKEKKKSINIDIMVYIFPRNRRSGNNEFLQCYFCTSVLARFIISDLQSLPSVSSSV